MSNALGKHNENVRFLKYNDLTAQTVQSLVGKDIGTGISLFHLIRRDFDKTRLTNCLSYINREGAVGITSKRDWKMLLSMLKDMNCNMTPANKRWVARSFGKMQNPTAVVWMLRSTITGDLWLGILDGCKRLSDIIAFQMEKYQSAEELLSDLKRVSLLGKWGRMQYSSKIFELYYGTGLHSEVSYECYDNPCVYFRNGTMYWGAVHVSPLQGFPVLADKEVLLLRNRSAHEELVPITDCSTCVLNRPQFQRQTSGLEVEVLDRLQTVYRYH